MESAYKLKVPLDVEAKVGQDWMEMQKIKPKLRIFYITNNLPDNHDKIIFDIIEFEAEFKNIEDYNMKEPNNRLCDPKIHDIMEKYKHEILLWLIQGGIKYNKNSAYNEIEYYEV